MKVGLFDVAKCPSKQVWSWLDGRFWFCVPNTTCPGQAEAFKEVSKYSYVMSVCSSMLRHFAAFQFPQALMGVGR